MKVQGFLLTQAGWGGAGQEKGLGRGELGRRCGKRSEGCVDGMWNMHVGMDGAVAKMSSRGRWARDADSLGEMLGKEGVIGGSTDASLLSSHHVLWD